MQVMVLSHDRERGRVTLSTKKLEPSPGDMLRDPQVSIMGLLAVAHLMCFTKLCDNQLPCSVLSLQRVFEQADAMAETFRKRVEAAELSVRDPNNPNAVVLDSFGASYGSLDIPAEEAPAAENYNY